jgi:hypothetical protein
MTARQQVLVLIAQLGADWQENDVDGGLDGDAWLPTGTVWIATGGHSLVVSYMSDRPAAWKALLADMQQGTEPCVLISCDTCERQS